MLTIHETLSDINKDITKIREHSQNGYLRTLFEHAFIPSKKLLLPEGTPPFKKSTITEVESKGLFWQEARKLGNFCRSDVKPFRRETLFIAALEALDEKSAAILLAVKDQCLSDLYPNITLESLTKEGYFK